MNISTVSTNTYASIVAILGIPSRIVQNLLQPHLMPRVIRMLRVSALHYLAGDWVLGGFRTAASACALRQPTSCRSEYFYNQRPQVRNLIGTERSLNRSEHRVKK